jgi:hypothetical protein
MNAQLATRYQLVVPPTATRIRLDFVGAAGVGLDAEGVLIVRKGQEPWCAQARAHQVLGGVDQCIAVRFALEPEGGVELIVGSHNRRHPVFIELIDADRRLGPATKDHGRSTSLSTAC